MKNKDKVISDGNQKYQDYMDKINNKNNELKKIIAEYKSKQENSRNASLGKTKTNLSTIQNNIDIEDVLLDVQTKNKKLSSSSQCKIINLDPNKRFTLPQSIADRYFTEQTPLENANKNLLPDIFVTINKSIEKETNEKG